MAPSLQELLQGACFQWQDHVQPALFHCQAHISNFLQCLGHSKTPQGHGLHLPFSFAGLIFNQERSKIIQSSDYKAFNQSYEGKCSGDAHATKDQGRFQSFEKLREDADDLNAPRHGTLHTKPIEVPLSQMHLENMELVSGPATKEVLGSATWTFLHTLAAQFPEKPTRQQQRDVKELMAILSRLYPCKECADHFKEVLKVNPVQMESGVELAQWMCRVHNVVNRSLGKAVFPCQRVDARWGAMDCHEGACDLQGRTH